MRAMYRTGMTAPLVIGQHKPRQDRIWTIEMAARNESGHEKMVIRPRQKCALIDLHDLVLEELAEFIREHGEPQHIEWTAHGR